MSIGVVTAIFGNYDDIPPVPPGFDKAVLVSDFPIESDWVNVVRSVPLPPRLNAKLPKFRPDLFLDTSRTVWIDAGITVETNWLYEKSIVDLKSNELRAFKHPDRNCIKQESEYCFEFLKYKNWPIKDQVAHYFADGFPQDYGLWAGGILVRDTSEIMKKFGDSWLNENVIWSIQDQISLPYLIWKYKLSVVNFEEGLYEAPLEFKGHKEINKGGGYRPDMDFKSLSDAYDEAINTKNKKISTVEKLKLKLVELLTN